ncbi:MAG: FAD-dependent oxidoreductase [Firmicutes bacterium]|nr:FAD-dependent oxidoreductase [[Eubacterium] siraeum]MCM1486929.1 FAD-dependent oxidoreductase [Bacillota bacterium]
MEKCQKRLWSDTAEMPRFKELHGDAETDVLIIGGGAAGLLCGYFLKKMGVDYIILEGDRILSGVTGATTAKITTQHGLVYSRLVKEMGYDKARLYFEANRRALDTYREMSRIYPCDFTEAASFVYLKEGEQRLVQEAETVRRLGFPAEKVNVNELPFKVAGAVRFPNQAQFNPVKFFSQIAKDLNIYEKTFVREMSENQVTTGSGTVRARKIIVASHFPILNKHGCYYLKMYQSRSYVIALQNAQILEGMYVDGEENGFSFRNYGDLLLLGGGGHKTGKKGGNWQALRDFAQKHYPESAEKYHWATQDCMTLDSVPYIGKYSKSTEGLYVAAGFNKWGMTSSMAAAQLLSNIVMGTGNKYEDVFDPSRSIIRPQLFVNMGEAVVNLIGFSKRRCPHLGCRLKWNKAENTWDCPCHGSRFSEDGLLLDNPSTGNIDI